MVDSLEVQGESDAHPVRTDDQVVKYCLKYVSKVSHDDATESTEMTDESGAHWCKAMP